MVKQQASHDNKGRYLTDTLEPSYRSANVLRQIKTMVESVEQQKLDGPEHAEVAGLNSGRG